MEMEIFILELTRRCNMECKHCLRGKQRNEDMPRKYLHDFFSRVDAIQAITLSGGEPSIAPHVIQDLAEEIKITGIDIGNFYIVTNGKEVSNEFLKSVEAMKKACSQNDKSHVEVSNHVYNKSLTDANIQRLKTLSIPVKVKYESEIFFPYTILNEGFAKENGLGYRDFPLPSYRKKYINFDREFLSRRIMLYLNTRGKVLYGCNWSYESQENPQHIICNAKDFSFDTFLNFYVRYPTRHTTMRTFLKENKKLPQKIQWR
ncbi:MAG: radical SAM protein [Thermotogota bacterium]